MSALADRFMAAGMPTLEANLIADAIQNPGTINAPVVLHNLPTDPTGLAVDSLWNNGGVVCIVT